MKGTRPQIGDVYEVPTPSGLGYIQYTHDQELLGQLVRVLQGLYSDPPSDLRQLVSRKEAYFIFYVLKFALKQGAIRFVVNLPVPEGSREYPTMRWPQGSSRDGRVRTWVIGDAWLQEGPDVVDPLPRVTELTPAQRKLSIAALTNHVGLVERLVEGWTPEKDDVMAEAARDARRRAQSLGPATGQGRPAHLEHFLYFSKRNRADEAGSRLRAKGMQVEVRRSAGDKDWLVLAKSALPVTEDDIEQVRDYLEALAEDLHGEYDGWGLPASGTETVVN